MAARKKPKTLVDAIHEAPTSTEQPTEKQINTMIDDIFQVEPAPVGSIPEPIEEAPFKAKREKAEKKPAPPVKLSTDKKAFVKDISDFISILLPRFIEMILAFVGPEYQTLAPTDEETKNIAEPLLNVYARHSKVVGTVSPDWLDVANTAKASAAYGMRVYPEYQEVKIEKKRQQKRTTAGSQPQTFEERFAEQYPGYDEYSPEEVIEEEKFKKLTPEERDAYAKLQQLTQQDYVARARRSGKGY